MTAPAAPATALPHGGSTSTLDCPAILKISPGRANGAQSERWWMAGAANQVSFMNGLQQVTLYHNITNAENKSQVLLASQTWSGRSAI
jgi:hypothetical protein